MVDLWAHLITHIMQIIAFFGQPAIIQPSVSPVEESWTEIVTRLTLEQLLSSLLNSN